MNSARDQYAQKHPAAAGILTDFLRAAAQLAPFGIGSAIEILIMGQIERMSETRRKVFFDELGKGQRQLTPEVISSEDFLHCLFATTSAAARTRRQEKIRWFARLLLAALDPDAPIQLNDEYEDYLGILSELSYRELGILTILMKYEQKYSVAANENPAQRAERFRQEFFHEIQTRLLIPAEEIESLLIRLNRSGTFETFYTYYGSADFQGMGRLLPVFYRLAELVQIQDKEISA